MEHKCNTLHVCETVYMRILVATIVVCLLLEKMIVFTVSPKQSVSESDVEAWSEQSAASGPKLSLNLRQNPLKDHIHFLPGSGSDSLSPW